ncbi:MAG: hypothetical protein GF317_07590 [Candidatus Lokiarchaeota archaeon]|nr:hypothetical protein [Candidatus Lokiarchaeota archaeon]MBD3199574.1 hypothetical protein [Candidatus Lokiarchaeota archaeon]
MYDLLPKVKTSKNTEETFDPQKIADSLVNETTLKEEEATEVAIELTRRVIAYKIKVLTSPEIREIVCSILLEKNYDKARFMYTRLGLPFYDFDELVKHHSISKGNKEDAFKDIESKINLEIKRNRVYNQMAYEYKEIWKILNEID